MPLQPQMKLKVDQMFLHWFHQAKTQELLNELSTRAIKETESRKVDSLLLPGVTFGTGMPCGSFGWGEFGRKGLATPLCGFESISSTPPISPRSPRSITGDYTEDRRTKDTGNLRKTSHAQQQISESAAEVRLAKDVERQQIANKLIFTPAESRSTATATISAPNGTSVNSTKKSLTPLHIVPADVVQIQSLNTVTDDSPVAERITIRNQRHPVSKPANDDALALFDTNNDHSAVEPPTSPLSYFPVVQGSATKEIPTETCRSYHIPIFYHQFGVPNREKNEVVLDRITALFETFEEERAKESNMTEIVKAADIPLYWKRPLFLKCIQQNSNNSFSLQDFVREWERITSTHYDEASQFVALVASRNRDYLIPEDFEPLIQDVVESHPGLSFLRDSKEFHVRYIHTVIARIWFSSSRPWHERLEIKHLRKSSLLKTIRMLQDEEDINQITDYFSYEHFYVVYCKFWEIDKDHDLLIDSADLSRHNEYALSSRIIKRIFSGAVRCEFLARLCKTNKSDRLNKMTYPEFVWFLIAEEDKRQPTSIEYWFRCMDRDGDGVLSFEELQFFYSEQVSKLDAMGIDTLPFSDCLCQILDMIKPKDPCKIRLADLKRCKMTPYFFDTFFNVDKYLEHEQRDPNASFKTDNGEELTDWEKFAAEEYEILVNEDGLNNNGDTQHVEETEINCDDDTAECLKADLTKTVEPSS